MSEIEDCRHWFFKANKILLFAMLIMTTAGLYCPAGNFYIDPSKGVEHAVVTHAHSDHARRGSKNYYCVDRGENLLKERLGKKITTHAYQYRESFFLNGIKISFHSAGHILGSSQVRLDNGSDVWVASGDYKREFDPTCEPFDVVPCDVFVTEATFGTPSFRWPKDSDVGKEIFDWWSANSSAGKNSVLFAYSLGKAQRVLGLLAKHATLPIYCHSAATNLIRCYRDQGISLADTICMSTIDPLDRLRGQLFLVPQSFLKSPLAAILGDSFETAFASGWMAGKNKNYGFNYGRGFVLSDHADWDDLVQTVKDTGAKKVYVQHRGKGALVRHLQSLGLEAYSDADLFPKNPNQLNLF